MKQRLDTLLVDLNLCPSRALAQRLIQAGEVTVNQQVVDKAGTEVDVAAQIKIKERSRFVSRGGEKLVKALDVFPISTTGRICLDGRTESNYYKILGAIAAMINRKIISRM